MFIPLFVCHPVCSQLIDVNYEQLKYLTVLFGCQYRWTLRRGPQGLKFVVLTLTFWPLVTCNECAVCSEYMVQYLCGISTLLCHRDHDCSIKCLNLCF